MSDLTEAERMFMSGAGFGRGGGGGSAGQGPMGNAPMRMDGKGNLSRGAGAKPGFGGMDRTNPAMQGRRVKIEGLTEELTDEMVCRNFRKFGVVDDWKRSGSVG